MIGKVQAALKEKSEESCRGVLLHQDNSPVCTLSQVLDAIQSAGFELLYHPSYLPEVAPTEGIHERMQIY